MKKITARKFGARINNLPEDALNVLYEKNKLWNALVEIDRYDRDQYQHLINNHPLVLPLRTKELKLKKQLNLLYEKKLKARQKNRNRKSANVFDEKIKPLKEELGLLYGQLKKVILIARKELVNELNELSAEHFDFVKTAKKSAPIWHHNNSDIGFLRYPKARTKAMKTGATLRFKRFDGTGRFYLSLQKKLEITYKSLYKGKTPLFELSGTGKYRSFKMAYDRIDNEYQYLTGTIQLHRDIPDEYFIKEISLTLKKIAGKIKTHVVFTCADEEANEKINASPMVCGVNFGFKNEKKKGFRVATLVGEDRGEVDILYLPKSIVDVFDYCKQELSKLDIMQNKILPLFKKIDFSSAPDEIKQFGINLQKTPKSSGLSLIKFLMQWKKSDWKKDTNLNFEKFRKEYKFKYQEITNLKTKNLNKRKKIYECWTNKICKVYGAIGIDDTNYATLAKVKDKAGAKNTKLLDSARWQRFAVSVSELRQILNSTAEREGVLTVKTPANIGFSKKCSSCNTNNLDIKEGVYILCKKCKTKHHVDENACKNIMIFVKNYLIKQNVT